MIYNSLIAIGFINMIGTQDTLVYKDADYLFGLQGNQLLTIENNDSPENQYAYLVLGKFRLLVVIKVEQHNLNPFKLGFSFILDIFSFYCLFSLIIASLSLHLLLSDKQ